MNSNTPTRSALARASIALVAVLFLATACSALPAGLFGVEATAAPEPTPSPVPIPSPVPTPKDVCTALVDLEAAVEDLSAADLESTGALGMLVSVNGALVETQALASAVSEVYRPLVDDLSDSLVALRDTLDALGDQPTLGASVATIGASITQIGLAMDALSVQLQTSCPRPSPAPTSDDPPSEESS